jgi:general secretion pathway protein G
MTLAPRTRRRAAFTLMEVLVVVAILVVLAGIGIGVFYYLDSAKERIAKTQIQNIETAVEGWKILHGSYPENLGMLLEPNEGKPAPLSEQQVLDPWNRTYVIDLSQVHPKTGKPRIYSQGANPGVSQPISNW